MFGDKARARALQARAEAERARADEMGRKKKKLRAQVGFSEANKLERKAQKLLERAESPQRSMPTASSGSPVRPSAVSPPAPSRPEDAQILREMHSASDRARESRKRGLDPTREEAVAETLAWAIGMSDAPPLAD
jgi:hypothetical protein